MAAMKRFALLLAVVVATITTARAEEPEQPAHWINRVSITNTIRTGKPFSNGSYYLMEDVFMVGYDFNKRWSVYLPMATTYALFDRQEGVKRYENSSTIGLAAGYSPLHTRTDRLELLAQWDCSIDSDWRYRAYEFGVRYGNGHKNSGFSHYVEAGVRYYDTYRGAVPSGLSWFVGWGIRF